MPRHKGRRGGSPVLPVVFFPAFVLFHELMLRIFNGEEKFFAASLLRVILFSVAAGLLVLPWGAALLQRSRILQKELL